MMFKDLEIGQHFKKTLGPFTMDVLLKKVGPRKYAWTSQAGKPMESTVETVRISVAPAYPPEGA